MSDTRTKTVTLVAPVGNDKEKKSLTLQPEATRKTKTAAPIAAESRENRDKRRDSKAQKHRDLTQDRTVNFAKIAEGKRVFTIAYRLFPERLVSNIEFAGSVFRQEKDNEIYTRKRHVGTARGRLAVRPLYATYDFSRDMIDLLFERGVPADKEERRAWGRSERGNEWKELRRAMDTDIAAFLRKQISKHGVRAPQRLTRSQQRHK